MQEIRVNGLDQIVQRLNASPAVLREARAAALEDAGAELLDIVRGRIGGTGRIQGVQAVYLGSGKGYVAVRAKAETYVTAANGKPYAAGAVTNAVESGHRQTPGRYVPAIGARLRRDRVPGKYMYQMSKPDAGRLAQETSERIAQEIVQRLEEGS
mgnify:CR=1 FL=1